MGRYVRKCPHCGSNQGFEVMYTITGHGTEQYNFKNGKILDAQRETFDKLDKVVECLVCHKPIDIDKVEIKR